MTRRPRFERLTPAGDNRVRAVCRDCGFIDYRNPKVVVGAVCRWEGRLLLCRRGIDPRRGFWTIPAGFLEEHESTEAGAVRETLEEAGARIAIGALLGIYNVPEISQVQILYRAGLVDGRFAAGPESLEVRLFEPEQVPWDELAFRSVAWALAREREVEGLEVFRPFSNSDPAF